MRLNAQLASIACAFLLLFACNRSAVILSYTNAKEEVPLLGNLVFRFNQSMVSDSLLNQWDSTDYVEFEPRIRGRFRWESPDQLVFSPAGPLNPATTYKATVKKTVLRYSEHDKVEGGDGIQFHTPHLRLDNSQTIWVGESASSASPQMELYFNYAVSPAAVKEKLQVESDGKKLDFTVLSSNDDSKITIRLNGIKPEDKDLPIEISLGNGLKPVDGQNGTPQALHASMTIASPFVVQIVETEAHHDGEEGVVRIFYQSTAFGRVAQKFYLRGAGRQLYHRNNQDRA